jgi:hypothetical protein
VRAACCICSRPVMADLLQKSSIREASAGLGRSDAWTSARSLRSGDFEAAAPRPEHNGTLSGAYATHAAPPAEVGRRAWRACAGSERIAASVNSSCAPHGPRNRRRPSRRMRLSGRTASQRACGHGAIARTPPFCPAHERHRERLHARCVGPCGKAPWGSIAF